MHTQSFGDLCCQSDFRQKKQCHFTSSYCILNKSNINLCFSTGGYTMEQYDILLFEFLLNQFIRHLLFRIELKISCNFCITTIKTGNYFLSDDKNTFFYQRTYNTT